MIVRLITATASAWLFAASVFAADVTELRYATAAPENTPWGTFLLDTVKDAEEAAEGSLKIDIFFSSQLGDEQTVIRQVVRGRIDISGQSGVATSLVMPEFSLLGAPYLFETPEQSDCVFDNHVRPIFEEQAAQSGLVVLSWVEVGHGLIASKDPIRTVADIQNYKLRIPPARPSALYFKEVGANGVPMGVVDMVPALKTGNVNGIATSTVYAVAIGLHKLAPHYLVNHYIHDIGTVTVSRKVWDKLTDKQQSALRRIDLRVNELRKAIRGAEAGLLAKVEEAGIPVYRPTAEELAQWQEAAGPAQQALVAELGNNAPDVWDQIQKAKKICSQ